MTGRGHFVRLADIVSKVMFVFPRCFASFVYSIVKNISGSIAMGVRYVCLKRLAASCGKNVAIFPFVTLKHIEKMHFGDNVSIHTMCYIDACGGVELGNNVSIAHSCSLVSFDHSYTDVSTPIKYNPIVKGRIVVEDDVWIGCGCRILQGVTIGTRCIIAAGAVVTGSMESHHIFGGVPAKAIKTI